ncbi:MAG TPA: hypothetical protein VGC40_08750 [Paenirhodobacter sp.]
MSINFIVDVFMGLAAIAASLYCFILSRRLKRFNQLEHGMGGAIAVLSAQVDDMTSALKQAQKTAAGSAQQLVDLTGRAEQGAQKLELMLASLHDLTDSPPQRHRAIRRRRTISMEAAE